MKHASYGVAEDAAKSSRETWQRSQAGDAFNLPVLQTSLPRKQPYTGLMLHMSVSPRLYRSLLAAAGLVCFLAQPQAAHAWGNEGHRLINRLAAATLPADEPEPPRAVASEAHAKLKRNLDLALDVHKQAMQFELPETDAGSKRLAVESATATVKAALTTDKTALKARSDNNSFKRVLLKLLFLKVQRGDALPPDRLKLLTSASREEIEAALGPLIRDYDLMNENAG